MKNILSQNFVFIDLETTGGSPPSDRIIEIGLKIVLTGKTVDEWQTLVNPKKTISPFIEHYTGISNEMVQSAPLFADIAETLKDKLTGAIFVAHNARFDYGFVKSEFRRVNMPFAAKVLCTVKLSRQLYPQYIKHNMDALIARHHLPAAPRHRAMGDVDSMLSFFNFAVSEHGNDIVGAVIEKVLKRPSLPSYLPVDLANITAYYGLFSSHKVADKALRGISETNDLCLRLLGLEPSQGACSWFQLGRCKGACVGEEDIIRYNLRIQIALHSLQLKKWPYAGAIGVLEKNQFTGQLEIHVINNWVHLGTVDSNEAWNNFGISKLCSHCFDKDSYQLISKYLLSNKYSFNILQKT